MEIGTGMKFLKQEIPSFAIDQYLSGFGTFDHDLHRLRRGAINRYFSKASISKLEPLIHDPSQKLCNKLLARAKVAEAFDVTMAYSCFTTDVI
jgi:cytochrome P450